MPLLNANRDVIAPDYPGYGGSDAPGETPTISDYAQAMLEFLECTGIDRPVDVLGFHTGCLVAAEMALVNAARIRRLVLCDVPCFEEEQRQALREKTAQPLKLDASLECLAAPWEFNITSRIGSLPMPRAFELFAEHLRAGSNDHFGFAAAFSYDWESRFAELDADVAVLATQSGLHEATVLAASTIRNATYTDVTDVTTAVFEAGAPAIAGHIKKALDA